MNDFTISAEEAQHLARQAPLALTLPSRGVAIIGCGGVGSWLAHFLALAGVRNLWLWDYDTIASHNLNRILLPPSAVGDNKAKALAATITALRPDCKPVPMGRFSAATATTMNLVNEIDWLVATTDTWSSRREAKEWTSEWGVEYLEAAAEGEWGSITGAPGEFATSDEVRPGYASVPVWIGPCVAAAMMAAAYVLHGHIPAPSDAFRFGWDRETERIGFFDAARHPRPQAGHWIVEFNFTTEWRRSSNWATRGTFDSEEAARHAILQERDGGPNHERYRATFVPDASQRFRHITYAIGEVLPRGIVTSDTLPGTSVVEDEMDEPETGTGG